MVKNNNIDEMITLIFKIIKNNKLNDERRENVY